jgi:putative flippase GtrA
LRTQFIQFVKFGVVGLATTFIALSTYYVFLAIDERLYMIGWFIGFVLGVLNAYYWNGRYVFGGSKTISLAELAKSFVAYSGSGLLGWALLYVLVNIFAVSKQLAPFLILLITVPLNFFLNKFWTFKKREEKT